MATGIGSAILDFGASPGSNEASVAVAGQTGILATSNAEAFLMAEAQANLTGGPDHTVSDATYAALFVALSCGVPGAGVGFTIYGRCANKMTGAFKVRWVWSD